jgi:CubicO group peptidase (beta-lactamase class C family)
MQSLAKEIDQLARSSGFSGVIRIDHAGETELAQGYGLADRGHGIANAAETRFAMASGSKGLTALAVVTLIEDGTLALTTPARSVLGSDLPLIGADVTVEHLLAHRSGIGDYLDESVHTDVTDYVMPVPVHRLAATEDYLAVLGGHPTAFRAGERFAYCNGGFVVLALIAERASGVPFHDLVATRVCEPAGMRDTAYLRSDELPGDAALNYLTRDGPRTNVLHLPVRGSGDGGAYTTAADMSALWAALFAGRIVSPTWVEQMTRPRGEELDQGRRYGLGLWLAGSGDIVMLEGYDAGVSLRSMHDPGTGATWTVIANWSDGAWPLVELLERRLAP